MSRALLPRHCARWQLWAALELLLERQRLHYALVLPTGATAAGASGERCLSGCVALPATHPLHHTADFPSSSP